MIPRLQIECNVQRDMPPLLPSQWGVRNSHLLYKFTAHSTCNTQRTAYCILHTAYCVLRTACRTLTLDIPQIIARMLHTLSCRLIIYVPCTRYDIWNMEHETWNMEAHGPSRNHLYQVQLRDRFCRGSHVSARSDCISATRR